MMQKTTIIALIGLLLLVAACTTTSPSPVAGTLRPVTNDNLQIVTGQILYVPAYSVVFSGTSESTKRLAVTLTIHNTDFEHPIIVQSVRYYNTDGEFLSDYVQEPVEVAPLATIGFIVPDDDITGGWGANFIVEWGAEQAVYEPIVEAVMISSGGTTQGVSMISPGRVLSETLPEATPEVE
jgi:hypothetical protein